MSVSTSEGRSRLERARQAVSMVFMDDVTPVLEVMDSLSRLAEDIEMYEQRLADKVLESDEEPGVESGEREDEE